MVVIHEIKSRCHVCRLRRNGGRKRKKKRSGGKRKKKRKNGRLKIF